MVPAFPIPVPSNSAHLTPGDFSAVNQARWEQTERELNQLSIDFSAWIGRRNRIDHDETGQKIIHQTRLLAIQAVFNEAIEQIQIALNKIKPDKPRDSGMLYDDCQVIDIALVWLQRLWEFYRVKFDQRDDAERLGQLLNAADELVWSCYKQIFLNQQKLPPGVRIGPAPLPFIASQYSPAAYEHGRPTPEELRAGSALHGLDQTLITLPVPLLRLPPWCVHSPWWLIFAAHEVGHHVQYELGLQDIFADNLKKRLLEKKTPAVSADRWWSWSKEIFADLFSLMMLGPWALRGLVEIERGQTQRMLNRRESYPAPAVRLELMRRAANRLYRRETGPAPLTPPDLPGDVALAGLDPLSLPPVGSSINQDFNEIDPVLDYALGDLGMPFNSLADLCNLPVVKAWIADDQHGFKNWSEQLQRLPPAAPSEPTANLVTPRLIAGSALAAWQATLKQTAADRRTALDALAENTLAVLCKSSPPGVRGEALQPYQTAGKGIDLAKTLLSLGQSQLALAPTQGE